MRKEASALFGAFLVVALSGCIIQVPAPVTLPAEESEVTQIQPEKSAVDSWQEQKQNITYEGLSCDYGPASLTVINNNAQIIDASVLIVWKHYEGTVAGTAASQVTLIPNSKTRVKVNAPAEVVTYSDCEVADITAFGE